MNLKHLCPIVVLMLGRGAWLAAEEPKADDKKPAIKMSLPLGVVPGATTKLVVRGARLDGVKEVRVQNSSLALKILSQGNAQVPTNEDPVRHGNTRVELEAVAPADLPAGVVQFTFVSEAGESPPHALLVAPADKLVAKREPNGGFRDAQPVVPGQIVEGVIDPARNVDVFRLELPAGQRIVAEVFAARHGSALDPLLTLYDSQARVVATNDDAVGSDARLEFAAPAAGVYYLSLVDALDQGGATFPYRLGISSP